MDIGDALSRSGQVPRMWPVIAHDAERVESPIIDPRVTPDGQAPTVHCTAGLRWPGVDSWPSSGPGDPVAEIGNGRQH